MLKLIVAWSHKMVRPICFLVLAAAVSLFSSAAIARGACRAIMPVGAQPYTAESYPLPLSLRINLTLLLKRELQALDRYDASIHNAVFTDLLEDELAKLQRERGDSETGCTTWEIVTALDSQHRKPPIEGTQ